MKQLELLAPARDAATAIAAIDHGADAVYIGAPSHGARQAAANSIDDIRLVVDYAHRFRARVYITLNTLVYDTEIEEVEKLIWQLYRIGVDALIVQDLGILSMHLPPIALHASTQCDIRTPEKALFLQQCGFTQLVLARELTLDEIKAIAATVTVPLEAFVHGALCVSYSGNCQASFMFTGRSANRGECAQLCRHSYDLIDGDGLVMEHDRHLLSLKDMNRMAHLEAMIEAGITSFKIEGRLKDIGYVKNVVGAYREALDATIDTHPDRYGRSSCGKSALTFTPDVNKAFNRGFTDYFLTARQPAAPLASVDTPKSIGQPVGRVKRCSGKCIEVSGKVTLNNGDGISYFDTNNRLAGFRINRVEGQRLILTRPLDIPAGTILYRNRDLERDNSLSGNTARRELPVKMRFRVLPGDHRIALSIQDPTVDEVVVTMDAAVDEARNDPREARRATLAKLGNTPYRLDDYKDDAPEAFVPASTLSNLKRRAIEALEDAKRATYHYDVSKIPAEIPQFISNEVKYSDNIANRLARELYRQAGVTKIEPALEAAGSSDVPRRVMLTRYCLRRQLGACLKTPDGKRLKGPLTLRSGNIEMSVEFDCRNCEMSLYSR